MQLPVFGPAPARIESTLAGFAAEIENLASGAYSFDVKREVADAYEGELVSAGSGFASKRRGGGVQEEVGGLAG